ncbi:mechanosensitive ion channel family protein [Spirulina sp. CS-785/01]|uniref:mechanosensitive ion channel family protein n=1 Tax=Spirulina sp. CS-785/01 TaxID=3021716 RepID=UPI00232FBEC0|nr:mechanosensitive ion channel family protein [Spirulina sp. CS-785/01]MDB9313597.1 mechanosensitive ion channel family protein [Spirulina sp. CS-785/01]
MALFSLNQAINWAIFQQVLAQNNGELSQKLLTEITVNKLLKAALTLLIAYGLLALIQWLTNWASERVARRFRLLIKQALPFWKGLILIVAVSYLLSLFLNLSQGNLIALTGTIAVALGFAFKDYVSSIIAGLVALFEAPYRVGDRIIIGDHFGEVVGYGLRGIQMKTPDDNLVTIPHNKTWTEAISNANSGQLEAQVATNFYFDHTINPDQVIRILYQAAYSSPYTQLNLPILVVMEEHQWGTQFKLRSYPMDARDEFIYKTDLIRRAKQAFSRHQFPYPKRFDIQDK